MLDSLNIVHRRDCGVSIGVLAIADETETTATTSVAVFYNNLQLEYSDVAGAQSSLDQLTASSTWPNSSNLARRAPSSVCHARPLFSRQIFKIQTQERFKTYPMNSLDMVYY